MYLDTGRGALVLLTGLDTRYQSPVQDIALWWKGIRQQGLHTGRHQFGRDLFRAGFFVSWDGGMIGGVGNVEVFVLHLVHEERQQFAQRLLLGSVHGPPYQKFHGMECLHAIDHGEGSGHVVRFR